MTSKLIVALAFSVALGTGAALAQTGTGEQGTAGGAAGDSASGILPPSWQGPIGDAFYSDTAAGTLRTQDEIRANWSNLTAEQQAQVRNDCMAMTQSESGTDNMQTSSTNASGATNFATVPGSTELCGWVADM